ncbi:23S rRNA (guanosine(2251)-2'-O)-methyltransferase RlmB [Salinicola rhizosphaerae]|uniref:23S rRNA (guanosine-2'-O-)-methyltransferase RlmB n=1 Tax=Salinicola rhizosphaerae TaxID=1443141 RepID=A0ABQ3DUC7_9GAMM|nr:23S rRNA (guanosine(2251)-2'-O)-methyltransferase RlmB [Salinicola rhizosphaerae]GHB16730.1 23S rRNA (guanosine-2'-O-)-methyltransferase RlmB [Salinicola rhizosphaerae]
MARGPRRDGAQRSPARKGERGAGRKTASARDLPPTPAELEPIYGVHAVQALFDRGQPAREIWVQQGHAEQRLDTLLAQAESQGCRVRAVSRETLDALSGQSTHQGVIGFCPPLVPENETTLWWRLEQWAAPEPPLLLILDGVTDPHNLGACLRSADAAGVHGIIVPKDKSAPLNATVRKVACGAAEAVPVFQVTNLARCMDKLKQLGVWITGTAGEADRLVYEADFSGPCALVMGAEGKGLRRLTREACDALVKLPMAGSVSSLNVSVAAGICLFEAVRQRR